MKIHTAIAATTTRTEIVMPAIAPALNDLLLLDDEEELVGMNNA